ncbi:response regulator [Cytophagaceae bacterium YF14B1]|uniref:histidine kinase n=1 Tax=Xanthocytophaga flava TaxID=3048013 RepID=A0AAE3QJC1_9BACT|nr:response regulator [Xanthocytophaga flavus]MDJ1479691.1 response regulator [Xanthocytophaga flavus]
MEKTSNTIIARIRTVFIVSGILLLLSSIASYYSIQQLIENSKWVNHTYQVLLEADNIVANVKEAEASHRGYLLTHENAFLTSFNESYKNVIDRFNTVQELTQDNPQQQKNLGDLKTLIERRFNQFEKLLETDKSRDRSTITNSLNPELLYGKRIMDQLSDAINRIEREENRLLVSRTEAQNQYISYVPVLVLITTIISMTITALAYVRIRSDMEQRLVKEKEERARYQETLHRIGVMETVTQKIASGDYAARSTDTKDDELGRISKAMNVMSDSLEESFKQMKEHSWLQSGAVFMSDATRGQTNIEELVTNVSNVIASYLEIPLAVFYVITDSRTLFMKGGYGVLDAPEEVGYGEGLLGQAVKNKQIITLDNLPSDYIKINSSLGSTLPAYLTIVPITLRDNVIGVIEIGSLHKLSDLQLQFLKDSREIIAISLDGVKNLIRLQELFEETQSQSEELQAQHNELENINAELEMQAQKLQASEEEMKVQQEELLQANQELEERSRLLEERNQVIVERNLEIQQKAEELALSTKYKSEFLANMSHELRTPLNSILLLSRLLSENNEANLSGDQIEYARVIQSSGNGLLALIDEILDLSKIESGKMDLDYAMIAVDDVATSIRSLFTPIAREKGLDFRVQIDPAVVPQIETDKMRLEQILKNLLSNALKFTSKGSVELLISPSPEKPTNILFIVKDTGIGISKEKQQIIFEAFQQADGSTRRKYGGTGLGLSISRELTRLLGGDIKVTSEPGQGSTFTFYIPVKQAYKEQAVSLPKASVTPKAEALLSEETKEVKQPVVENTFTSDFIPESIPDDRLSVLPTDKVILIVEDDIPFAKALLQYTQTQGYKAIVAVRGDEGIILAQQYKPTGILLDIQLPVKSGWEVMEVLKASPKTRHIPVHIMSSHYAKKESLLKGAVDFINKPVAFEQMQEVFKKIEHVLTKESKKVLIVEENTKHAKALAYFLETFNVHSEISESIPAGLEALNRDEVECVILDMGIPDQKSYEALESIKRNPGLESLPIIIFTGKSLSKAEESRLKQYADSIVVKTAHSYQRILDEVSLFLHLMEESRVNDKPSSKYPRLGGMSEVLANKKVLIADDDVRNIFSLTKALEAHQMVVLPAMDGKEAVRVLEENPDINLVLMDIMMPEMDGYEAMQRIRQQIRFRNLPIIAVTAKAMTGDRERCIQAGASDYISKPVDIDQLISLLRVWLYDKAL